MRPEGAIRLFGKGVKQSQQAKGNKGVPLPQQIDVAPGGKVKLGPVLSLIVIVGKRPLNSILQSTEEVGSALRR